MRITVYPESGAPVALTGTRPEEWVEGLDGALSWGIDAIERCRAVDIDVADLGNIRNALSFRVARYHDTADEAGKYYLDHPGDVPHTGRVEFEIYDGTGAILQTKRKIDPAAITVTRERWHVCETIMRYDILGGRIRNTT